MRTRSEAQEQEFDRIRAGRTVVELSDAQVQGIAHEHYFNTLLVDEMSRERGLTEEQYEALEVLKVADARRCSPEVGKAVAGLTAATS